MFFQELMKFADYNVQANVELDKLSSHLLEHGRTKTKLHVLNATDLSRYFKIIKYDDDLVLKLGQI